VDPANAAELVARTNASQIEMRGRAMPGWLHVRDSDLRTSDSSPAGSNSPRPTHARFHLSDDVPHRPVRQPKQVRPPRETEPCCSPNARISRSGRLRSSPRAEAIVEGPPSRDDRRDPAVAEALAPRLPRRLANAIVGEMRAFRALGVFQHLLASAPLVRKRGRRVHGR
jgi:hypothetical protein